MTSPAQAEAGHRLRWLRSWRARRLLLCIATVLLTPLILLGAYCGWLLAENDGTPSPAAHGTGADALWLGHAWVDGRRSQSDVDLLDTRVRDARISDLLVHVGPLSNDGSLDPGLRPKARWLLETLHTSLPGVRVQAWLGDIVGDDGLHLSDAATQSRVLVSVHQVLDDGFDGIHYDFEPVPDGNPDLPTLLAATHAVTQARHVALSVSADQLEPLPGLHVPQEWAIGHAHWWSAGYLRTIASNVDQVAVMAYDSGNPFEAVHSGYLRVQTRLALRAVPPTVTLFMGIPAYHTDEAGHTAAETVSASIRGIRLALGASPPKRPFGLAFYADFSATPEDWAQYLNNWAHPTE